MDNALPLFGVLIVFGILAIVPRRRKSGDNLKNATQKRIEAETRVYRIRRDDEREQELAAQFVEKQNKTFELYEQVRRSAAEREQAERRTDEPPEEY